LGMAIAVLEKAKRQKENQKSNPNLI